MRVVDLKALAKERRLRGYSTLKKAESITFLQNNLRLRTRPPPPPPQSVRPRQPELLRQLAEQPSSREMDIVEQQEMHQNRPQITSELNNWRDWLDLKIRQVGRLKLLRIKSWGCILVTKEKQESKTRPSTRLS